VRALDVAAGGSVDLGDEQAVVRPADWSDGSAVGVEVSWKGADIPVHAQLLEGEERAAAWKTALAFWPPYATYQARVEREIRLFRIVRR